MNLSNPKIFVLAPDLITLLLVLCDFFHKRMHPADHILLTGEEIKDICCNDLLVQNDLDNIVILINRASDFSRFKETYFVPFAIILTSCIASLAINKIPNYYLFLIILIIIVFLLVLDSVIVLRLSYDDYSNKVKKKHIFLAISCIFLGIFFKILILNA
jgi:hypothetical protein